MAGCLSVAGFGERGDPQPRRLQGQRLRGAARRLAGAQWCDTSTWWCWGAHCSPLGTKVRGAKPPAQRPRAGGLVTPLWPSPWDGCPGRVFKSDVPTTTFWFSLGKRGDRFKPQPAPAAEGKGHEDGPRRASPGFPCRRAGASSRARGHREGGPERAAPPGPAVSMRRSAWAAVFGPGRSLPFQPCPSLCVSLSLQDTSGPSKTCAEGLVLGRAEVGSRWVPPPPSRLLLHGAGGPPASGEGTELVLEEAGGGMGTAPSSLRAS